ncbi:MAG: glutamate--tRNA ligase [Myxococcota bacterium]
MRTVRTRFAPSPTGELHIGNARTALFAYLFAKRHNGKFILRLEDTDTERSKPEYSEAIIEDMSWLNLGYDEGPYRQSERMHIYREYLNQLIEKGVVYECFCTPQELEERRRIALKSGKPPVYDGRCSNLPATERNRLKSEGKPFTYRFRFSNFDIIKFEDVVRKEVVFNPAIMGDPIIVRADGVPAYNFACTIDDMLMGVTDVIRGEDLLDQTPRQIALLMTFGADIPRYAHLPLIFGKGKKPLSKRDGATSVAEFRGSGFLPIALLNYLYRLGYSPETDKEILSLDEMSQLFQLERVSSAPAIFDMQKLKFLNREAIRGADEDSLTLHFKNFMGERGDRVDREFVRVFKEEIFTLNELRDVSAFLFDDDFNIDLVIHTLKTHKLFCGADMFVEIMNIFLKSISGDNFNEEPLRRYIEEKDIKPIAVFMMPRIAITGREKGPALRDIVKLLGLERVKFRVERIINYFSKGE